MAFGVKSQNASPTCDSNWSDVVLLLPFNGTNGGTTTTDVSSLANAVTITGNGGTTSNASPHFAGDLYLSVPTHNSYNSPICYVPFTFGGPLDIFRLSAWTIECWVKVTYPGATTFGFPFLAYCGEVGGAAFNGLSCFITDNNNGTVTVTADGTNVFTVDGNVAPSQTFTVAEGSWNHFAITSDGTRGYVFFNGQLFTTTPDTWKASDYSVPGYITSPNVVMGSNIQWSGNAQPGGVEQVRVTAGIARYTANFTPPSAPFPTHACTVPSVIGDATSVAEAVIVAAGYTVGTVTGGGIVAFQTPVGGTAEPGGTAINISSQPSQQCVFVGSNVFKAAQSSNLLGAKPHIYDAPFYSTVHAK